MSEHPIKSLLDTSMQKIREMVDVDTIIGDPITTPDGTVIIPVSKISFGFASGGLICQQNLKRIVRRRKGAGISIQPLAFLVVSNGEVKLLQMHNGSKFNKCNNQYGARSF